MPRLSCWCIRGSLLHLTVGFTLGALLLFHRGSPLHPAIWKLLTPHIECMLFGWTLQLVMGVAFWILPRHRQGPERGNETPAWLAWGLLNLGVGLAGFGWMLGAQVLMPLLGRVAEAGVAIACAVPAWSRVKAVGV